MGLVVIPLYVWDHMLPRCKQKHSQLDYKDTNSYLFKILVAKTDHTVTNQLKRRLRFALFGLSYIAYWTS